MFPNFELKLIFESNKIISQSLIKNGLGLIMIFDIKKSSLQNTQTKNVPSLPSTRPAIQLEVKFRLTISQEQFLQADDGSIDNILLF